MCFCMHVCMEYWKNHWFIRVRFVTGNNIGTPHARTVLLRPKSHPNTTGTRNIKTIVNYCSNTLSQTFAHVMASMGKGFRLSNTFG